MFYQDWEKWRLAYTGGTAFINRYLYKYSARETNEDFLLRKQLTYSPSFAKVAVNEVKNAIYDRMSGVVRKSDSQSYLEAIISGVDRKNSSMNYFIGTKVLPELLVMRRVAVCVDKPTFDLNANLAETYKLKPYLYIYTVEQILDEKYNSENELIYLKLEDSEQVVRTYALEGSGVTVVIGETKTVLNLTKIPVVIVEISESLMQDISDYQIALLNLCSSDVNYIHKSNFPFYVEMYEPYTENLTNQDNKEVKVGPTKGRKIAKGLEFPQFINPSSEPLKASMEKQEQIKQEIRLLVNLTLGNLTTARKSAESKQVDQSREETGLSYIGLELQSLETQILQIWKMYEGKDLDDDYILYPTHYNLKTSSELVAEATTLVNHSKDIASKTYRKEIAKKAVSLVFENVLPVEKMTKINEEIDSTDVVNANPETIIADVENGLVSKEFASKLRGYPSGEVDKAKDEHAERMKLIGNSQGLGARGLPDLSPDPKLDVKLERNRDTDVDDKSRLRGKAK